MKRVAVIGAGPSGLSVLNAFARASADEADVPDVVCFEKQSTWGGMWNFTWRTGLDGYGDPVHGSMYRDLWSNGPKECLEFADYSFDQHNGEATVSFPTRDTLHDYITGRAHHRNLDPYIRFNHVVRTVSRTGGSGNMSSEEGGNSVRITVDDVATAGVYHELFDHVVVATGHFSAPFVPEYPGFDVFPGRILHAHDFRDAREFTDKAVLVVGGSYSAEDITLQLAKHGAEAVILSCRSGPMGFNWPSPITEASALTGMNGRTAQFVDGTRRDVEAIVLCTGYRHHFPFLDESLQLRTDNNLYPDGLYQGIFWLADPVVSYIGMQDQYYSFTMFDAQAHYLRDVLLGRISLPDVDQMRAHTLHWRQRMTALRNPLDDIDFQTDYVRDLVAATDYPDLDFDLIRDHFRAWEEHKTESIIGYRDHTFTSAVTTTEAVPPQHPWWQPQRPW